MFAEVNVSAIDPDDRIAGSFMQSIGWHLMGEFRHSVSILSQTRTSEFAKRVKPRRV